MDSQHKMKAAIICFFLLVTVYGCGGGGGGGDDGTANIAPVADAGLNQIITIAPTDVRTITLAGTSSENDGTVVSYQWVQTGGPTVLLTDADKPTAFFTVPDPVTTTAAYTFDFTVTDNDGAQGTSNVAVYVTAIIFSDSFSDGNGWEDRWIPEDDTENSVAPFWQETALPNSDGQLLQSNNLQKDAFSDSDTTSYHVGTYAFLDPSSVNLPPSYRFSADIKPLSETPGTKQGNDVGIMFGYNKDLDNYYRVSMSARYGFTRFEKRSGGTFETLAVNSRGYVDDQAMNLTAEINGDTIIIWIDGFPVFAEVDPNPISGTVALYCQDRAEFDNIEITEIPLQPEVVLSTPLAHSVALTQDDGDLLEAEAIVLNMPVGGSVDFNLLALIDGSESIEPGANEMGVYLADFPGVVSGEYEVMAVLKDADGKEVGQDINSMVGVGGDYYLALGDSITNGEGDFVPGNNDSSDGRTIAIQGYQARLADLLTGKTGRPQIVFNEGINGDAAEDLESRIDSIMERHPRASKILLMIGTNDAGRSVDATVYENTVRRIIGDHMNGRQVWLAKPMKTFENDSPITWTLNAARNGYIVQYNQRINQIVSTIANTSLGPNFYLTFTNIIPINFYYDDYLHPNDGGYGFMANQWSGLLP